MFSGPSDAQGTASADEVALFHRTLAELLRSEVPLGTAFRVVEAEMEGRALRRAARSIAADVDSGETLGAAYAHRTAGVLPAFYGRLLGSGEAARDLPAALEQIAHHAAQRAEVTNRMRRALAYPLTTAVFVLLVTTGVLVFASPKLWAFTERVSGQAPWPVAIGALAALAVVVTAALWLVRRRRRDGGTGGFGLPVVGRLRLTAARAALASTLALLLRREMPLPEALRQAAETAPTPDLRGRVLAMAQHAESGEGLAVSLRAGEVFEPSLMWLVETGAQGGSAAGALEDVAALYRQRLARGLDRCTVLVRPAMELVVGVAVLFIAYSFMVPLFSYAEGLFRF